MTRRRKTDGERIAEMMWTRMYAEPSASWPEKEIARNVDRLLRKRMGEAWAEGHEYGAIYGDLDANPYRGRKKK